MRTEIPCRRATSLGLGYALLPALVVLLILAAPACRTAGEIAKPADEQFGHRFEGRASDGRETIRLEAAEEREFRVYPAVFDTVHVRVDQIMPADEDVPVEVLIKGAFPDACTTLHAVDQERAGNIINVELTMRRPVGALCASVLRPYRFYLPLEGRFEPGPFTLKLNGGAYPFEIRRPSADA